MRTKLIYKLKWILAGSILLLSMIVQAAPPAQTLRQKMTPPGDPNDRENLKIWIPAERPNQCRLVINILDSSNQMVRHFVDYVSPGGYLNFYWDKRDDSGNYVEPGTYRYEADDCGKKLGGSVKVEYKKWERLCRREFYKDTTGFFLELLADSADVSVEWYNLKRRMVGRFYMKDDLQKGIYHFNWVHSFDDTSFTMIPELKSGFYVQKLIVGDYSIVDTVRFFNVNE